MDYTETNKLIAEFMGGKVEMYTEWNSGETWEICTLPKESNPLYMQNPRAYGLGVFKTEDFKRKNVNVHERYLQYHTSWVWLMPVVEKIEDIRFDNEDKDSFVSYHRYNVDTRGIGCTITDVQEGKVVGYGDCATKRESTYQAIIEFIKNK